MANSTDSERPLLDAWDSDEYDEPQRSTNGYGATNGSRSHVEPQPEQRGTFERNLGTIEAFAIVISIVIGSGAFTSPGAIDTNVPSPGVALIIWLVGGILAWTGASTFAELGTAIPGEGGVQSYLQHMYGELVSFMAAWTWIIAVMPATLAILSIVFVESAYSAAGITDQASRVEHKLLSIAVLALFSIANCISTKASTRLNGFFVVIKFTSIAVVVICGLVVIGLQLSGKREDLGGSDWRKTPWFGYRTTLNPDGSETHWAELSQWEIFGHYSAAVYGALWAYSGWDKAIYVSAELKNPARQLPFALNSALPTIIVCFLAANASYYILLPWDDVSTTDSAAVTAITRLLGQACGVVAAVFICIVCAGTLLGTSFIASRMTVAAANKQWCPSIFTITGRIGIKHKSSASNRDSDVTDNKKSTDAPINAVILAGILATLFILFGNFRDLLTLTGLGEYVFFFLAVLGAVIMRYREPDLARPYKPFVLVPLIFILVCGLVVVRGAAFAPILAAVLVIIWVIGLIYYWAVVRKLLKRPSQPS